MSSDSDDWNEWDSDGDDMDFKISIQDLYNTTHIHQSPLLFLQYINEQYKLDLKDFMNKFELNTYNRIRCCNYLRKYCTTNNVYNNDTTNLSLELENNYDVWYNNDDYLIPVIEGDGLVQYAATANHNFDSDDDQFWEDEDNEDEDNQDEDNEINNDEDDEIDLYQQQIQINKSQSIQIKKLQHSIEQLSTLLDEARTRFKDYAFAEDNSLLTTSKLTPTLTTMTSTPTTIQNDTTQPVNPKFGQNDHYYFASYSNRNIHEEMLSDKHRTESYQDAFKQLQPILKDKVVLDVGCGTGILSMFAAHNGAKHVIGVDAADIIDQTREIVKMNGFENKITLVKGKVEELILPLDTVDIIVSEWMGYYLLYESMLPSVFYARNKWLRRQDSGISIYEENKLKNNTYQYNDEKDAQLHRPFASGTRLLPDVARMYIAGCHTRDLQSKRIGFWQNVYGFDMSVLINQVDTYPNSEVEILPGDDVITTNDMYGVFDLMTNTPSQLDFKTENIQIIATQDDTIDSFIVWFDTPFTNPMGNVNIRSENELKNIAFTTQIAKELSMKNNSIQTPENNEEQLHHDIILTTAPNMVPTHWKQTIFRLKHIMKVQKGDKITLTMNSYIRKDNHRHYNVDIKYSYQTSLNININDDTKIMNTNFAKPGDIYEQSFSLQ